MSRARTGNALLETALAFPVLAVIMMGVVDYGRIFSTNLVAGNAARAGAQVAILNPEKFAGSDFAASVRDLEDAIETQDPQQRKQVAVTRFTECPGMAEEQPYPAGCTGASAYLRVKVSVPLESTFRYPAGTFPTQVAETAVVRIN